MRTTYIMRCTFLWNLSGYRHICLRNELNQPQGMATLFVFISVGDYIHDAFAGNVLTEMQVCGARVQCYLPFKTTLSVRKLWL